MKSAAPLVAGVFMLYWPYFWCWYRKESFEEYGLRWGFERKSVAQTLAVTAVVLSLLTPAAFFLSLERLPHSRSVGEILRMSASGLAAAVIEETFFRGWMQTVIKKFFSPSAAIVITNMVFAPAHLLAAPRVISLATFFPGLVMGALKERYGNIFPSILFHFLGNVWSIWFFPSSF